MKKSVISKVISIVFALITILAIACAITGSGSGFEQYCESRMHRSCCNLRYSCICNLESEKKVIADKAASKEAII